MLSVLVLPKGYNPAHHPCRLVILAGIADLHFLKNANTHKIRPTISILTCTIAALLMAPTKKIRPPINMDFHHPNFTVIVDAKKKKILQGQLSIVKM